MPVLEAVTTLECQESRANDLGIRIGSLSGKVSGIRLAGVSANLTERFSTVGVGIGIGLLVVKLS
jgi:hypothetical protein